MRVELLNPRDLTADDIRWLAKGCADSIDEIQASDQVDSALAGKSGIYRVSGEAEGIFVLTHMGSRMEITAMAGKGFIKFFEQVHEAILVSAAACGARQVSGFTKRQGLAKLYKTKTQAQFAEYFVEDIL